MEYQNHISQKSCVVLSDGVFHGLSMQNGKGHHTDHHRKEGARGRSQPHGKQRIGKQLRGQIGTRDPHQHNGQDVVEKGQARFSTGAEVAAEAEMDARKYAVPDVAPSRTTAAPSAAPGSVNRETRGSAVN